MDNEKTKKKGFTYRELTLLIGVIVAVIVIFTLWIRQPFRQNTLRIPIADIEKVSKVTLKKYVNAFEVLRSNRNNPY